MASKRLEGFLMGVLLVGGIAAVLLVRFSAGDGAPRRGPDSAEIAKAPDRAPKLMAAIRDDLDDFSRRRGPIVMGGRSMGGRMTTMVAADVDGAGPVGRLAGLVLICYPLHPPGKPDKLRVEHLPKIPVPCLFISGTRDPFGSPDELERWTATIPVPVEHHWIDGGRHDLKGADDEIAERIAAFLGSVTR
jgi:predicted alpha/beta-hydrolase family hydrolase